jgi:hypothetical protein
MGLSPNCLLCAVDSLGAGEIKLVMLATAGIERGAAIRASVAACHVFLDGHFISASPAEHRGLSPFRPQPNLDLMAGQCLVTLLAGEIYTAALHLDGDHVESGPIVSAPSLCIQIDSANFGARELHGSIDYRSPMQSNDEADFPAGRAKRPTDLSDQKTICF